ncbi:MAG: hypothetical protein JNL34_13720 [Anaerolineae bacterium]|nr:hypothetical protein [Anaerolineae bacterium]
MPSPTSPFADDWRDCLIAHYQNVLRNQDHLTEGTLLGVLQEAGFSDQELAEFKVRVTMRAEDMGPDFMPDLDALKAEAVEAIQQQTAAVPNEPEPAIFEAVVVEAVISTEDETPALPPDEEPPDYRADGPQQLSMF